MPYATRTNDGQITLALLQGVLPATIPTTFTTSKPGLSAEDQALLYDICSRCWNLEPDDRPSVSDLRRLILSSQPTTRVVSEDPDGLLPPSIRT